MSMHQPPSKAATYRPDRYKVHLPWKKLPDNYELSIIKQLNNLFKCLSQYPEILKEYDSVFKEQLKNGIVEVVEKPADG